MKTILILTLTLLSTMAWAHGDDKLGPHQGYIRMPGAFHTEVVPQKNSFQVYLLDMNWKNPTVVDSEVSVQLFNKEQTGSVTCTTTKDHFHCLVPMGLHLLSGKLVITATRKNAQGNDAVYELPFALTNEHSGHH